LTGTSSNAAFVYVSPFAPWVVQTSLFWTYLVHPSKLHWLRVTTPPLTSILVHPTWLQSFLLAPCAMRDTNSTLDDKASRLNCHIPRSCIASLLLHEWYKLLPSRLYLYIPQCYIVSHLRRARYTLLPCRFDWHTPHGDLRSAMCNTNFSLHNLIITTFLKLHSVLSTFAPCVWHGVSGVVIRGC
jgi:hypothetical protein